MIFVGLILGILMAALDQTIVAGIEAQTSALRGCVTVSGGGCPAYSWGGQTRNRR